MENAGLGTITAIEKVENMELVPTFPTEGSGGQAGMSSMINNVLVGYTRMDGYRVTTDQHTILVLIENQSSCCESFGYFSSDDNLEQYLGAGLREVRLTDTALNAVAVEDSGYYDFDKGGIQFVDFDTNVGVFQLAVYNAHNGYYGHGIVVAVDEEVWKADML